MIGTIAHASPTLTINELIISNYFGIPDKLIRVLFVSFTHQAVLQLLKVNLRMRIMIVFFLLLVVIMIIIIIIIVFIFINVLNIDRSLEVWSYLEIQLLFLII